MAFCELISDHPIVCWNEIVAKAGALTYKFFFKEPFLYMALFDRENNNTFETQTDEEILSNFGISGTLFLMENPDIKTRSQLINWAKLGKAN